MSFLGDLLDNVGTALNAPELGWSEGLSNNKATKNTGRVPIVSNNLLNTPTSVNSFNNIVKDKQAADLVKAAGITSGGATTPSMTSAGVLGSAAKVLNTSQLASLQSLLDSYDLIRTNAKTKAGVTRDTSLREKADELDKEKTKYEGKKLTTLQDFAGAKTDTDLNTTRTLENLISSLSTMGLGGSKALTRQILDAANVSNRKANTTQATNNQSLDQAFNDYTADNENDVRKINDQFNYDIGEADRNYGQNRQNTLYKMADVYDNGGVTGQRDALMRQGDDLNSLITGSAFLKPSYTGATKSMAAPDLSTYEQDIAKYDTSGIGGLTPVGDGTTTPGNLAVKALAVNDKDLGVKKKIEGDLGLGV